MHIKPKKKRPDMLGNKWRVGIHPWNYGKKGVYKKETLELMSIRKSESHPSNKHKENIRVAMKKLWENPIYRKQHHKAMLKWGQEGMLGSKNPSKRRSVRLKMSASASRPEVIDSKARQMPYSGTKPELIMRAELKRRNIKFRPNVRLLAHYNVDILIKPNIIIECDGDYWHSLPRVKVKDKRRDFALRKQGYRIYRFWESVIKKDARACVDKVIHSCEITSIGT